MQHLASGLQLGAGNFNAFGQKCEDEWGAARQLQRAVAPRQPELTAWTPVAILRTIVSTGCRMTGGAGCGTWKIVMSSRARMTSEPPGIAVATAAPPATPVVNKGVGAAAAGWRRTYSDLYPMKSESLLVHTMLQTACDRGTSRLSSKADVAEFQNKMWSLYLPPTRQHTASEHDEDLSDPPPTAMARGLGQGMVDSCCSDGSACTVTPLPKTTAMSRPSHTETCEMARGGHTAT